MYVRKANIEEENERNEEENILLNIHICKEQKYLMNSIM